MYFPCEFGSYKVIRPIGEGSFSHVMLVENEAGEQYAAKIVNENEILKRGFNQHFEREIEILKKLSHPNIVSCKEVIRIPSFIIVIMEYCQGGDLLSILIMQKHITESECLRIARQILEGLDYIHNLGIAHRDIKLENIVFDNYMTPKIIDFGFSTFVDKENQLHRTQCGSFAFVPPELFTSFAYDPKKADIWSLGITIFVMIAGHFPWSTESDGKAILRQIYNWDCVVPDYFPKSIKILLSRMLVKDPFNRATTQELLSSKVVWTKINGSSMGDIEIRRGFSLLANQGSQTPEPLIRRRTIIRPSVRPRKIRVLSLNDA